MKNSEKNPIYLQNLFTFICAMGFEFGKENGMFYIKNTYVTFIGTDRVELAEQFKNRYDDHWINHVIKNREKRYSIIH